MSFLPRIKLFDKKLPLKDTPAQATAKRVAEEAKLAQAERAAAAAAADVSAPIKPSPPASAPPTSKAPARRRVVVGNTMRLQADTQNCICSRLFANGSYKNAHELGCAIESGSMCDKNLNGFTREKHMALIQNIIYENEEEPIEEQWGDVKKEIERQQSFVQREVALDIKLVILQFKNKRESDKYEYIKNNEFGNNLYERDYPENLEKVIMIMERMRLPVQDFNALGLAEKLINARVMSCDYKYNNTGQYVTETGATIDVLIDWDTKHQTVLTDDDMPNNNKLVSFMMLEYIIGLLTLMIGPNTDITDKIYLFNNVRGQLRLYYPDLFVPGDSGLDKVKEVITTALTIFGRDNYKDSTALLNLVAYNPLTYIETHDVKQLDSDIHKILQMNITDPKEITETVAAQIKRQYAILTPKGSLGGSRKRSKTKRRRSHKKKKGTRKMFR